MPLHARHRTTHKVYFNDGLEGIDTHAMEDRISQDTGVVYNSIELAVGVDRHLDDFVCWQSFCDGFEIRDRSPPRFLISSTTSSAGKALLPEPSADTPGSFTTTLAPSAAQKKCDLTADATPRARDDDDLVA